MHSLGYFLAQTWRSVLSFFLSFVVLGLMVWFTPDWVQEFVYAAGQLKLFIMGQAESALGYGQPSALFGLLVGDTAIALTLITLFTRVVVLTLVMWLGGLIFGSLFGGRAGSRDEYPHDEHVTA
jgi:hypothetical protein